MGKKVLTIVLIGCLMVGLCACGKKSTNQGKSSIKIGVTLYDQYDAFLAQMMDSFEAYAEKVGKDTGVTVTVEIYNAAASQSTQNDQVEEMIEKDFDVICVNLVDRTDPSSIIDAAEKANVPVVFFNRELVEEDLQRWDELYYVGATALESGIMEGELAADYCKHHPEVDKNRDGVIQYVVLEGEAGHQDAIVRTEYSVSTIQDAGITLEKVDSAIANWNRDQAKTQTLQLLEQKKNIELYICNNDAMALGVIDAYESLEYDKKNYPAIFGIDGIDEGLSAVKEESMVATVYNDKEGQAEAMLELAYRLATNESVSDMDLLDGKYIRLPYAKVDSENVDSYLTTE